MRVWGAGVAKDGAEAGLLELSVSEIRRKKETLFHRHQKFLLGRDRKIKMVWLGVAENGWRAP